MVEAPRKKSPRAPSISLSQALDRVIKVYDKEGLNAVSMEAIANDLGYKSANNGAALSAIASLRYYGLLERPKEGQLAVSKDVESFRYALDDAIRRSLLIKFLKQPPMFAELLDKYDSGLPPDSKLLGELIERGFLPATVEFALTAFKQSVEFAGYYDSFIDTEELIENGAPPLNSDETVSSFEASSEEQLVKKNNAQRLEENDHDRIPVRLPGGRRAWLLIPALLYEADKIRLKAQIDLLLTEDEREN